MKKVFLVSLVIALAATSFAQEKQFWHGFPVNLKHLETRVDSFQMFIDGKKVGSWRWEVEKGRDEIVFKDVSILDGQIREDAVMEVDSKTLSRYTFDIVMASQSQGWKLSNNISWQAGHAKGKIVREDGKGGSKVFEIDSLYAETTPREIFVGMLPSLELNPGRKQPMKIFSALSGQIWEVRFEVRKSERVKVAAGEFETTPVALLKNGAQGVSNIFYVSQTTPRRIVKIDVLEQNMTIELVRL